MILETSMLTYDSSVPCWNDAIEGVLLEVTEVPFAPVFSKNAGTKIYGRKST